MDGFFKGVKCPGCNEELQPNDGGPFNLNSEKPKNECIQFNNELNAQWDNYKNEKLSEIDFRLWLNKYRTVQI